MEFCFAKGRDSRVDWNTVSLTAAWRSTA
jgi:hypothetical protein